MYERKVKYTTVSISEDLMNEIKKHIRSYDYVSVADFLRIAVKERIKIDTSPEGAFLEDPTKLKPTLENIQKQMKDMQDKLTNIEVKIHSKKRK